MSGGFKSQPSITVKTEAEAKAPVAAAWDAADARGDAAAAAVTIAGATGFWAEYVNGTFDRVPSERAPGGAPVYKRRTKDAWGRDTWLFLACDGKWFVCIGSGPKDARKAAGVATTVAAVAPGTLPHEAPAGGWKLFGVEEGWEAQPSITVTPSWTAV